MILVWNGAAVLGWMLLFWLMSIPLRNVAIVDLAWGLGFIIVANLTLILTGIEGISSWLLPLLTTIWGLRLSGYLYWRNHGKPEDKRYQAMRQHRGESFVFSSLWIVFGLQAVILWIVSLPLQIGIREAVPRWHALHLLGILLWLFGFLFETIGDYQLARFLADPASQGRVMNRGLWRYTRHPNYFGDFLVWWGLYLVSIAGTEVSTWWTIIGPLLMSFFLMRVSGVTLLESTLKTSRPGYAEYIRQTSAFFPWRPGLPKS